MKKYGLFDVIKSIKKIYCQDVAIISCEELTENRKGNCKKIVTEYMPSYICHKSIIYPQDGQLSVKNVIIKKSCPIPNIKNKLSQIFDQKKIKSIFDNIFIKTNKQLCWEFIFNCFKNKKSK